MDLMDEEVGDIFESNDDKALKRKVHFCRICKWSYDSAKLLKEHQEVEHKQMPRRSTRNLSKSKISPTLSKTASNSSKNPSNSSKNPPNSSKIPSKSLNLSKISLNSSKNPSNSSKNTQILSKFSSNSPKNPPNSSKSSSNASSSSKPCLPSTLLVVEKSSTSSSGGTVSNYFLSKHCTNEEKLYSCDLDNCTIKFDSQDQLQIHKISSMHKRPRLQCNICPEEFSSQLTLKVHLQEIHGKPKGSQGFPKCKICNLRFQNTKDHRVNNCPMEQSGGINCDICNLQFSRMTQLLNHQQINGHTISESRRRDIVVIERKAKYIPETQAKIKLEVKAFQCKKCFIFLSSQTVLDRHYDFSHSDKHICPVCSFKQWDLESHLKICKLKNNICDIEKKETEKMEPGIVEDFEKNHGQISKNHLLYTCPMCDGGEKLLGESYYQQHYTYYHTDKYVCKFCGTRIKNIKYHMENCNYRSLVKVNCPSCKRWFISESDLNHHMCLKGNNTIPMVVPDQFQQGNFPPDSVEEDYDLDYQEINADDVEVNIDVMEDDEEITDPNTNPAKK